MAEVYPDVCGSGDNMKVDGYAHLSTGRIDKYNGSDADYCEIRHNSFSAYQVLCHKDGETYINGGVAAGAATSKRIHFRSANVQRMLIDANGVAVGDGTVNTESGIALKVNGTIKATNYKSSDGTTGGTEDVVINGTTLTFKDGLFISAT